MPATPRARRGRAVWSRPQEPSTSVGWPVMLAFVLAFVSTSLMLIAPLLVTLALKVGTVTSEAQAPGALASVAGAGGLVALVANPLFGRLSDRTTSRFGRRRPWMVIGLAGGVLGTLVVATATTLLWVVIGWCVAQLFFNALLAALVAVLPDRFPSAQRGTMAGILGICTPIASVAGTYLVQLFDSSTMAMLLGPCGIGAVFVLAFVLVLREDRASRVARAPWSPRLALGTFVVDPRRSPDFSWAFVSRFLFVLAYAFLATFQAYFLISSAGSAVADVPRQIFLGTVVQTAVVIPASLLGGRLSDRTGRRKPFVLAASLVYGAAMLVIAAASGFDGFLVGMAISGLGFGLYAAVDLALVVDVLPRGTDSGKDLGVLNLAGAVPFSVAPAVAPAILAMSGGDYAAVFAVAGCCAVLGGIAITRVRRVR
jgi:MFS family permease